MGIKIKELIKEISLKSEKMSDKVAEAKALKMRKDTFRGKNLEELLNLGNQEKGEKIISQKLLELFTTRVRRRIQNSMGFKYKRFLQKIRKAEKNKVEGEKPAPVK